MTPPASGVDEPILNELEQYLSEPVHPDTPDFNTVGIMKYFYERKNKWPTLVKMWRQFHGCPSSSAGVERLFYKAGKQHDDQKKSTKEDTLERSLKVATNTKVV